MPDRKKESKRVGGSLVTEGHVLGDYSPKVVEHGKKFAAYDKNGKLIILGYDRKIVQDYANAQKKLRSKR